MCFLLCTEPLHSHLECNNVEYLQFAFRWKNNLLMREMPLRCTIRLWDTYLVSWFDRLNLQCNTVRSLFCSQPNRIGLSRLLILWLQKSSTGVKLSSNKHETKQVKLSVFVVVVVVVVVVVFSPKKTALLRSISMCVQPFWCISPKRFQQSATSRCVLCTLWIPLFGMHQTSLFTHALIGYSSSGYPVISTGLQTQWTRATVITFPTEFWPDKIHFFLPLAIHWFGIY